MTDVSTQQEHPALTGIRRDALYIDGAWVAPAGRGSIDVVNASTEEVMGGIPEGNAEDVDRAVAAARRAFEPWAATPLEERAALLDRLQEALTARAGDIAALVAAEVGMPMKMARSIQAGLPATDTATAARALRAIAFEEEMGSAVVVREPIGVVAAITPWNYPLHQVMAKVAPAIGTGCTVVLKPSEVAPFTAFLLADILDEIGLPRGVFNLVTGYGPVVGEAMATHRDVDMVSFTGSVRAGTRVAALAAETVKKVTLELGGKSPNVILDDAPLGKAVGRGVNACMLNSGQTCNALTRMLVPRELQGEAVQHAVDALEKLTVGDPFAEGTRLGPLVSAAQRDRVRGYIERGVAEGARLVAGGAEPPDGLERGYYVRPTIFADVTPDMTIAREEIFGPVLSIMPYDGEEDAVRIANDTDYGLAAAVWSGDAERARRVARRLRAGQVEVNGGAFTPLAPFGGYRRSGLGRELGRYGVEEFLEVKALLQ